jgi:hypothetical protein
VAKTVEKAEPKPPTCNLPHCRETDDLTRGLCPAHWSTHRGLADEEALPEGAVIEGTLP